jgi:Ca2+-binding EF-hand superfamily protein
LTWKELHGLLAALHRDRADHDGGENALARLKKKGWTESHTLALTEAVDKDKNGKVDIDEFIAFIFPMKDSMGGDGGSTQYEKMMTLFRRYDKDRNGRLDERELTDVMASLRPEWTAAHTKDVFADVDKDGSGFVESAEFVNWVFGVPTERAKDAKSEQRAARQEARRSRAAGQDQPDRASRATVTIGDSTVRHTGRSTVVIGSKEARNDRSHTAGKSALVVVEFRCGKGHGETKAKICENTWNQMLGGQVRTKIEVEKALSNTVLKVSARDGQLVFWEHGMIMYREDPFKTDSTTIAWAKQLANRDLGRLIDGTYIAAGI